MRKVCLLLALIGWAVPYYFFISFLTENGLDLTLLLEQLFANDISTFFAIDLLITAVVFWAFLYREARRLEMRRWWVYVVATLVIGPSFALPMYLFFREGRIQAQVAEVRFARSVSKDRWG